MTIDPPKSEFDDFDATYGATITVVDVERAGIVTYRSESGSRFRVLVRQKSNPIGFMAKLRSK